MRLHTTLTIAVFAAAMSGGAFAQAFPAKAVRIVVPFPPGGGVDIVARVVGPKLTEIWGQQVVVDNRAGASGMLGTEVAARAAPDGYTLLMGTMGNLAVNPHLFPKMTVDPLRDFAPVTLVVNVHFVMVAHPSLPVRNVKELIALARARPGQINYSSSGAGGAPHLGGELFKRLAKVDLTHIPYKGSGPSFQDLLGGQVSLTFDSLVQAMPYITSKMLRPLAVLGATRSPLLSEVPTVAESGVPGYELTNWFGLAAPAATPPETIVKIHADFVKVLQQPNVREKLAGMGADVVGNTPEQFGAYLRTETAKWAKLVKDADIRGE
jgi:tripartite-type tricarboxylate transporter receptor subunit TctC